MVTDARIPDGLVDIRHHWTIDDVTDAHDVLDALECAEKRAHDKAQKK